MNNRMRQSGDGVVAALNRDEGKSCLLLPPSVRLFGGLEQHWQATFDSSPPGRLDDGMLIELRAKRFVVSF